MILDLNQWALLFGVLMPVLVGVVTKANASAGLKATVLLFLELATGVMTEFFASPGGFDWRHALVNALAAFITGVAAYYGFLKHTVNPPVVDATARFGMGGSRPANSRYYRDEAA